MVDTVTGRLHLLPRHIGHTKAASGRADPLLCRHLIRRGDRDLRCPFRLQKFRHLRKAETVAVMGGVLPVLMQHHNIGHRQGVSLEVCRVVDVKAGIDAFQTVLLCQRGGIDQFIVLRLYGKPVVADGIQRFKAVIPCGVPRFQLVDRKGISRNGLRLLRNVGGRLHIGGYLRRILPFCLFCKSQHFVNTGLVRILQRCLDLGGVKIQKFLIARSILEFFNLRRKIVLLRLPQRRQLFVQSGNASGHQIFIQFFLCGVCLRVLRRILRIVLTEKLVHVKGDIHSPLGFFFFGKVILESHYPVLVGDTAALTVVILMETVTRITHIALIREGAVFFQRHVPSVGFIINVVLQVGGNLSDFQFLNVITPQVVIVLDIGVNLITIQILGEVNDLLQAAGIVTDFHSCLELRIVALIHFIQLGGQIV